MPKKMPPGSQGSGRSAGGKPRGPIMPILRRLGRYALAHKWAVLALLIGFIASAALSLVPAWLVRIALDEYLVPDKVSYLWTIAGAMLGAAILQGAVDYFTRYLAETKGQAIVYTIRQQSYSHLLKLSFSYFDQSRLGDLMSRVTADAETLQVFFGFALVHILNNGLFIIGILAVMFVWSYKLALLYILMLPFIVIGITRYAFTVRPVYGRTRQKLGELTGNIQEQLQGIQVIKIFGREKHSTATCSKMNEQYFKLHLQGGRITSFWMPYVFVLIGLSTGIVIWLAGREVISGALTLGTLVGFTTYIGMMMRPVRQTGMLVGQVIGSAAAAERIFEVLDTRPEIADAAGAKDIVSVRGDVAYTDVSFSYDQTTPVLENISFNVKAGETIAVVGPTGAGKTTLIHLLPRFYEAGSGQITIDGIDTRQFTLASLRRHIGIVLQTTFLFNSTIEENIAFGKPGAKPAEIRAAARAAEIDEFIMGLPEQYRTPVGERGVKLSGGQRQRLAIARTLLMDPRILILDEPTSSVDAATDEKIQAAVAALCRNRTVFVIAHRLWTLKNADRILVIEDGRLVQFGTPEELINRPGLFQDIYTLQVDSEKYGIVTRGQDGEVE